MILLIGKFWKEIVIVILVSSTLTFGYFKIKSVGYQEAATVYQAKIDKYEKDLEARISSIEKTSTAILDNSILRREEAARDFKQIMAATKGRPLYTITSGICAPNDDFIRAYNDAVARANRK